MLSSLSPGFLVASTAMKDPHFRRAVVLLIEHQPEGSFGFIINRPASVVFEHVIEELGLDAELADQKHFAVLNGGPVAPHTGWIVFDPQGSDMHDETAVTVSEHLCVSASRDFLQTIAKGEGPPRNVLVLGYAGWDAGQLDEELKQGSWIPIDLDERIVFDTPHEARWKHSLDSLGIDPARLVSHRLAEA
ncbi:MAG: YqgE/AlgH family protein [Myxococcales bacterium]|nr:MAG: YqgE/AlgH family protein [Myxococcales bacterium]